MGKRCVHYVSFEGLPEQFPTQLQAAPFWEELGRAVGTFGFLEEVLTKAIFALTATRPYPPSEVDKAYAEWLPRMERALTGALGALIDDYERALRDHPDSTITNVDEFVGELRKASQWRNVLCHGSWRPPSEDGASMPFFVDRKLRVVDSAVDREFIRRVRQHAIELACGVINTVTQMGWQFPGTGALGAPVWVSGGQKPDIT